MTAPTTTPPVPAVGPVPAAPVPHLPEPKPGWRCECGSLAIRDPDFTAVGVGVPGHEHTVDVISAGDPGTDPDYVAAYGVWNQQVWDAVLTRTDHSPALLDVMIRQATGWPRHGFAYRSQLIRDLLRTSHLPLKAQHLRALCHGDGIERLDLADALLAHPAADASVLVELVVSVTDAQGQPLHPEKRGVRNALFGHRRTRTAQVARMWMASPRRWTTEAVDRITLMSQVGQAKTNLLAAVRELDTLDASHPGLWSLAGDLWVAHTGRGVDFVPAVAAALAPAVQQPPVQP